MPLFSEEMRGMRTKYKMLWFVVDIHHRQRYFFICGLKRTVTCLGVKLAGKPLKEETSRFFQTYRFPDFCKRPLSTPSRLPCAGWSRVFADFQPIERIP
jgi:hypothetical protein